MQKVPCGNETVKEFSHVVNTDSSDYLHSAVQNCSWPRVFLSVFQLAKIDDLFCCQCASLALQRQGNSSNPAQSDYGILPVRSPSAFPRSDAYPWYQKYCHIYFKMCLPIFCPTLPCTIFWKKKKKVSQSKHMRINNFLSWLSFFFVLITVISERSL